MPSFGDMIEVVDLLQLRPVECDEFKCVAVRNRNSKCTNCEDACIADAITVSHNEVNIDSLACVNCGCCIAVCPNSAIHPIDPSRSSVLSRIDKTCDRATGMAVVACERKASRREGDPERYANVPCLGHMTEGMLVSLAAKGIDDIVLVDGNCASCKYGASSPHIDAVIDEAAKLLDAANSHAIITRASEFPPEVIDRENANVRGKSRRGLMRQTGSYVKTVAGNVASKAIDEQFGNKKEPMSMQERLRAGKRGHIPAFKPACNYELLDNMTRLNDDAAASDEVLCTRHFGEVSIDPEKCSGCGMCVLFCPTEALKYAEYDEPTDKSRRYLEFQASDCTQCMLCKDVCLRDCLEVSPKVTLKELLDFEPKLLEIPRPKNRTSLADLAKRRKG